MYYGQWAAPIVFRPDHAYIIREVVEPMVKFAPIMDDYFDTELLSASAMARALPYLAGRQDYMENAVNLDMVGENFKTMDDVEQWAVNTLLKKGHFGPFEHIQFTIAFKYFPHEVVQQVRTHRVGISFDVQSGRYTGKRILDLVEGDRDIEAVFYYRPVGEYVDRTGTRYEYTDEARKEDLEAAWEASKRYRNHIANGVSYEAARNVLPWNAVRQHFVMSANARTIMHLLDMRFKPDAQLETQTWAHHLFFEFQKVLPLTAEWYEDNRLMRGRLAP